MKIKLLKPHNGLPAGSVIEASRGSTAYHLVDIGLGNLRWIPHADAKEQQYRDLKIGDLIEPGDEFLCGGKWRPRAACVGEKLHPDQCPTRRPFFPSDEEQQYRDLKIGDLFEPGDEFLAPDGEWRPRNLWVEERVSSSHYPTRRPAKPANPDTEQTISGLRDNVSSWEHVGVTLHETIDCLRAEAKRSGEVLTASRAEIVALTVERDLIKGEYREHIRRCTNVGALLKTPPPDVSVSYPNPGEILIAFRK